MPRFQDGPEAVAWSALLVLILRSLSVCAFLFVTVDWNVLLRSAIQVHVGTKASSSHTPRLQGPRRAADENDTNEHNSWISASPRQRRRESEPACRSLHGLTQHQAGRDAQPSNPTDRLSASPRKRISNNRSPIRTSQPPPPYSLSPTKTHERKPSMDTIMRLYEDIMASDSQTIEVQQEALSSQQDIIRSQTQVIARMREMLEEQDARIDELEDRLGGL